MEDRILPRIEVGITAAEAFRSMSKVKVKKPLTYAKEEQGNSTLLVRALTGQDKHHKRSCGTGEAVVTLCLVVLELTDHKPCLF
jgi:hypothetical protein